MLSSVLDSRPSLSRSSCEYAHIRPWRSLLLRQNSFEETAYDPSPFSSLLSKQTLGILGTLTAHRNYLTGNGLCETQSYNFGVGTGETHSVSSAPASRLGVLLRQWRSTRRMSQLNL